MGRMPRIRQHYLSVPDAAAVCGVSRNTVYTWVRRGQLPAAQTPGRTNLIRPAILWRFMESNGMFVPPQLESMAREDMALGQLDHSFPALGEVLVIDNDPLLRSMVSRAMQGRALVDQAQTGFQGLHLLTTHERIRVVLVNLATPGARHDGFLQELKILRPDVEVLIVVNADDERSDRPAAEGEQILVKPLSQAELDEAIMPLLGEDAEV